MNPYESPRELHDEPRKRWAGNDWFVHALIFWLVLYCVTSIVTLVLTWLAWRDGALFASAGFLLCFVLLVIATWNLIIKELHVQTRAW